MKNMTKNTCSGILLLLLSLLAVSPALSAAETVPSGVEEAARRGLPELLQLVPPGKVEDYGFSAGDTFSQASLGQPFRQYTIEPSALLKAGPQTPVSSLISPTETWFFPVMMGDSIRCILTVARVEGSWKAVALGKASLGKELNTVLARWPRSQGYEPRLVAVFQAAAYFFTIPQKDDRNLTPMSFDGKGFGADFRRGGEPYARTVDLSEVLEPLKGAVEANIRSQNY